MSPIGNPKRALKQAMMQGLLTGRTRLISSKPSLQSS
jgi:hypothetical protein